MTDLIADLKSNNLKVTPQRLAIYSYLCSTEEHPSAETIYSSLKEDYPNTVSYTHLDVYKRQLLSSRAQGYCQCQI